jgi:hypothetical protein
MEWWKLWNDGFFTAELFDDIGDAIQKKGAEFAVPPPTEGAAAVGWIPSYYEIQSVSTVSPAWPSPNWTCSMVWSL